MLQYCGPAHLKKGYPMKAKAAMKAMKAAKVMSKGGLATELAEGSGLKKGEITKILDSLAEIGTREVKKAGKFTLPGLCMIKTRKKKATFLEMKTLWKHGVGRFSRLAIGIFHVLHVSNSHVNGHNIHRY